MRFGILRDRVLSTVLLIAILGALGILLYSVIAPPVKDRYTEFYLLGLNGKAGGYPEVLTVGMESQVIVGIVNREQETVTYRMEVSLNGAEVGGLGPLTFEPEGKWVGVVGFTPRSAGERQKVEFWLYRQGLNEVYQSLHLWVDVN
ncbi:MAG: DUF1616 domain-containing protein [Dehalococcoidales bacterium]|nr:DUF1616 domain-containing protein [Dehalococcoidales bacterium]